MKSLVFKVTLCLMLYFLSLQTTCIAYELSGYVATEGRMFFHDATFPEQSRDGGSFAFQPEYYNQWESGQSFLFVPYGRYDSSDPQRTHFDIREMNLLYPTEDWEFQLGVGKVFWGVTEFVHLVDIINQTDLVENIDEEDKLGQPMARLSVPRDWGILDVFVLPYFRERTFPGPKGRLRHALVVDIDHPIYESDDEEQHVDFAARYSHTIGDWDIGISHFIGTGREPTFLPGIDSKSRPVLIPYYEQINQTGLDLQLVAGQWLWKLESLYRTGQGDGFLASIGGFEYSFVGVAGSNVDLGLIGEYVYDERRDKATTIYENDAMLGMRIAANDVKSTEFLGGLILDMDSPACALTLEASRRFGSNWKLLMQAWGFFNSPKDDLLYNVQNDDFLQVALAYYY